MFVLYINLANLNLSLQILQGDFDIVAEHRKDIYNFLEELLEFKLPLNSRQRWDWICIVNSKFGADYRDDQVLRMLKDFGTTVYNSIKYVYRGIFENF